MPRTTLTRSVAFAAAHRYHRADWSEEKNTAVFGPCARPNYHGHGYRCDVTVTAELDGETGFIIDLAELDRILDREVKMRFDHRNINLDVPEFAEGKLIPTGENLARFIFEQVQAELGSRAIVESVRVAEDSTLSASYQR